MMQFEFYPPAEDEYLQAARYYDGERAGLGDYFIRDVEEAISRICRNPLAWGELSRQTRRCLTHNFPYGVIYALHDEKITIIAVMDLRRKPGYWKGRSETMETILEIDAQAHGATASRSSCSLPLASMPCSL